MVVEQNFSRRFWRRNHLGDKRHRRKNNIKIYQREILCADMDWMHIAQNKVQ